MAAADYKAAPSKGKQMAKLNKPKIGDVVEIRNCIKNKISKTHDVIYGIILQRPYPYDWGYIWQKYYAIYVPNADKDLTPVFGENMELRNTAWAFRCLEKNVLYLFDDVVQGSIFLNNRAPAEYDFKEGDLVYIRSECLLDQYRILMIRNDSCLLVIPDDQTPYYSNWARVRNKKCLIKLSGRQVIRKQNEEQKPDRKETLLSILKK